MKEWQETALALLVVLGATGLSAWLLLLLVSS